MPKKRSELIFTEIAPVSLPVPFLPCVFFRCCIHFFTSGLAMLVKLYVKAINTPGAVPNMELAWDIFVKTKCSEAQTAAKDNYKVTMSSHLEGALPCEGDFILRSHSVARFLCESFFYGRNQGNINHNSAGIFNSTSGESTLSWTRLSLEILNLLLLTSCRKIICHLRSDKYLSHLCRSLLMKHLIAGVGRMRGKPKKSANH